MSTRDRQQETLDTADADRIEAGYRVENAKREMLASVEVSDAIAAHEADPDPHPGYLTPAEGDAAYDAIGAAAAAQAAAQAFATAADTALLAATISNGDSTHAPTGDAVFDALALKDALVPFAVATGTGDALAADFTPDAVLVDGGEIKVRASAANTGAATLAVDGGTARAITKLGGTALAAGDISAAGHELRLRYRLSVPRWELLNPAAASGGGGGSGDSIVFSIPQAGHGFSVGHLVAYTGSAWVAADRDGSTTMADGLVSAVADANNFTYMQAGKLTLTTAQWDARTGDSGGLTAGEFYFTSSTAGGLTKTAPTTGYKQVVLKAISTTVAIVMVGEVFDLGSGSAATGGLTLIASTTLVSASGVITVSGLDLATHKLYQVRIRLKNNTASAAYAFLTYNADTTGTNYDAQVGWFNATTGTGQRFNNSHITYVQASDTNCGVIEIMQDFDGKASAMTRIRAGATTQINNETFAHHWRTAANVTSLTVTCANNFAIGSSIEVWA